jgi:FixJ family two-component response regulator
MFTIPVLWCRSAPKDGIRTLEGQVEIERNRECVKSNAINVATFGPNLVPTAKHLVAIVEDDAAMRKSLARLLHAHGYSTVEFGSAEEFLQSGIADSVIGLVLDIHLPGMSGIELRRHLLAAESSLPVVFITAFDDAATRVEALALGCAGYLQKPFEASRLTDALGRGKKP